MGKISNSKIAGSVLFKFGPAALFALWSIVVAWIVWAEPPAIRTFGSPAEAGKALFQAAQAADTAALMAIFGADGKTLFSAATRRRTNATAINSWPSTSK